jgi:recombination protein RecA
MLLREGAFLYVSSRYRRPVSWRVAVAADSGESWCAGSSLDHATLSGRLTELSGVGAAAVLTLAFTVVREIQERGELVAWIMSGESLFYPPDASDNGVDCEAVVVVRVPDTVSIARAAEILARSGAFGLVVLDLGREAQIPTPVQARLLHAAQRHEMIVLCLTDTRQRLPSLGSLVSLRLEATRQPLTDGQVRCEGIARKDKRYGPGWRDGAVYAPPLGLC